MKNKFQNLIQLFKRLKNFRIVIQLGEEVKTTPKNVRWTPEQWQQIKQSIKTKRFNAELKGLTNLIKAMPGSITIILDKDAYDHLITGLVEADQWTGFPYSEKVFEQSTIIKN